MTPPRTRATVAALTFSAAIALAGCAATPDAEDRSGRSVTILRQAPAAMRAQAGDFCGGEVQAVLSGWVQRSHHGGRRFYALYTIWTCKRDEPG